MTYLPGGIESYALVGGAIVLTAHPAGSSNPRLFIEASGQIYRAFDVDAAPGEHADALALGVAVGWRWTWRSGVNAGIGAGAAYFFDASNPCDGRCVMTDEGVELRPFLDGGYAF
jgi:hypothetical protein